MMLNIKVTISADSDLKQKPLECGLEQNSIKNDTQIGFRALKFSRSLCDECGAITILDQSSRCVQCGIHIDSSTNYVADRIATYAGDIGILRKRLDSYNQLILPLRGNRLSECDYPKWILSAVLLPLRNWPQELNKILYDGSWDNVESAETQREWRIVKTCYDTIFDRIDELLSTPPPVLFLAQHRNIIRAALKFASAMIDVISVLIAQSIEDGKSIARSAELILDDAGKMFSSYIYVLKFVHPVIRGGKPRLSIDGALLKGNVDIHAIFPEVAELMLSNTALLAPLKHQAAAAALTQDPVQREQRMKAALAVLLSADAANEDWVSDPSCLITNTQAAWRQLNRQHDRFIREIIADDDSYLIDSVLDIFSKLCEGPLRKFGSIIAIASQVAVGRNLALNHDALFKFRKLPEVYKRVDASAPPALAGVYRLLRNAEAHYDYIVTNSGVIFSHLPPNARSADEATVDEMSQGDVLEQTANLLESSLALCTALLRWAALHVNPTIREAFRAGWLQLV